MCGEDPRASEYDHALSDSQKIRLTDREVCIHIHGCPFATGFEFPDVRGPMSSL
jgi:hypothetical protein